MYINAGAYVGDGTMVDSHASSAAALRSAATAHLGGDSDRRCARAIGALPVIVEDDVHSAAIAASERTVVKTRAVLGAGTILNRSTPVYDLVQLVYKATDDQPLVIPAEAVVGRLACGQRPRQVGFLYTPVIVKYRDAKTDTKIQLEDLLR
jgi:2,3,4,5-tetrahydropyridine-2-carboxylate N-succinyltransferase